MIGFISTLVTISLNYSQYIAIADLHNLQFTVAHALRFSVSTSRLLATDINTETITSNNYEVFLSSTNFPWLSSTQNSELNSVTALVTTVIERKERKKFGGGSVRHYIGGG
jgi:hypothetical protein